MTITLQEEGVVVDFLNQALEEGKEVTLEARGFSMEPLFSSGDKISFRKKENFKFGDILVCKHNSCLVVHRFIRRIESDNQIMLVLKGDNRSTVDEPINSKALVGVVTKINKGGRVIKLDSPRGSLRSFFFLLVSYLNLIFKTQFFVSGKDRFANERKFIRMLVSDNLVNSQGGDLAGELDEGLNWGCLSELIKWNFLSNLFVQRVKELSLESKVPEKYWLEINNRRLFILSQDVRNRAILDKVFDEFDNRGVEALIIKGSQLGIEVYPDSAQRWQGDIDLVVKVQDWQRASDILRNLGFQTTQAPNQARNWAIKYLDSHIDFYNDGIKIELKVGIWPIEFPYFNYDLWSRARKLNIGRLKANVPSCEDTLLIACVNLMRHNFSGLIWFIDIRNIINTFGPSIDWQRFIKLAKQFDLESIVYQALCLTKELLALDMPQDVLDALYPGKLKIALFNISWDKKAITLESSKPAKRIKLPFELSVILFGGKFSFEIKKMARYLKFFSEVFAKKVYLLTCKPH